MLRLTFTTRIGLIVVLGFLGAWIGSVALFYISRTQDDSSVQPLPAQIAAIVNLMEHTPPGQQAAILRAMTSDTLAVRIEPGIHIDRSSRKSWPELERQTVENSLNALGGRPLSVRRRYRSSRWNPKILEFHIGLRTGQTLVGNVRRTYTATILGLPVGFSAGLIGTLVALIAVYLLHRETKPLARLAAAVDRIDLAALPAPLAEPESSAPEIQALVGAFNRLQNRLALLMKGRLAMLGGISHDVRTFATRLRLRLDEMPEGPWRERAVADIEDIIHLLDDALLASRAGADELAEELIDVAEIVRIEVSDRQARGVPVTFRVSRISPEAESATVLGDRLAVKRVIANLIDNALKYGKRAEVTVGIDQPNIVLTVDDDGPGIPSDKRDILLEPFVRLENSRNRQTGGAGLGLAIVRNLVEAQGGFVTIADAPIGGARFVVRLPLFEPD